MSRLRIFPHLLALVLTTSVVAHAQVPPSLGVGSRIQVTSIDGDTYTGTVAPKPPNPLWQLVSADGQAINFRLSDLLSVRMLGRAVTLTPGWAYNAQTFPWAAVQTTDGQSLELGIYKWPSFSIVRDDTGLVVVNNSWVNRLSVVAAVARPATKPGLASGARALVTSADGSYEGTVFLDPKQKSAFAFVRLDTRDQWQLRLQDIHRFTATGRTDGGLDVIEVETTDGQVYTVAVYSRSAFDLVRATGEREVNLQSRAAFKGIAAMEPSPAATTATAAVAPAAAAPAAQVPPPPPDFDFTDIPRPRPIRPPGR